MNILRHLLIVVLATSATLVSAQAVQVISTQMADSAGNLATGTLTFRPNNGAGQSLSYRKGGGGLVSNVPVTTIAVSGVSTITLPDTDSTNPLHVCFALTLATAKGGGIGPGYGCLQPHYTAHADSNGVTTGDWCQAGICNLDNYIPSLSTLPVLPTGPQGQQGVQGVPGTPSRWVHCRAWWRRYRHCDCHQEVLRGFKYPNRNR
jgi:hypothetical protein